MTLFQARPRPEKDGDSQGLDSARLSAEFHARWGGGGVHQTDLLDSGGDSDSGGVYSLDHPLMG